MEAKLKADAEKLAADVKVALNKFENIVEKSLNEDKASQLKVEGQVKVAEPGAKLKAKSTMFKQMIEAEKAEEAKKQDLKSAESKTVETTKPMK